MQSRAQESRYRPAFSIPMRGNELGLVKQVEALGGGFSIPMRGNERVDALTIEAVVGFSIPMRGNETWTSSVSAAAARMVFDPHEG